MYYNDYRANNKKGGGMKKGKQKSDKQRVELTTAKILLLIAIVELLRKLIEFAQYLLETFVQ